MSSPAGMSHPQHQQRPMEPQSSMGGMDSGNNEDGVSVRPMRLKVLYTFDDQNKTNCLARWPHVLQIQTVAMDETTSIGVIELKTCIQAIVQCSPELVARLGQDYTVYAYDYSEYDNPLVGQGMLSWALAAASPTPDAPAHQSNKLITGRVCKNILGLFNNGVRETLEVKLRLVPVPTVLQSEYINAMEKYRELSKVMPTGFDANEWTAFLQSNPNIAQLANKMTPVPTPNAHQRDGSSMEVVNQLLSPSIQQQSLNPFSQPSPAENLANNSSNEASATEKGKSTSRPTSRTSTKRQRKPRAPKKAAAASQGGNTSGYEEGTDGDDGPALRKRAKITKTDWTSKSTIGSAQDSLRVAASTSGSLRMFRPIAISPMPAGGSHLQEIPRAPTPVPHMANQHLPLDRPTSQSGLRRDSFQSEDMAPRQHLSPYPVLQKPEDQPRFSIESANNSPERNDSPGETPPEIGSSPPVMRTRPPSRLASSPPCPSSPMLPQMPRTDSGFMSGSLDDLFGEEDNHIANMNFDDLDAIQNFNQQKENSPMYDSGFVIEEETPGPMDLLPTKMLLEPPKPPPKQKAPKVRSRQGSVMSEDGQQTLPPLRKESRPAAPSGLSTPTWPQNIAPAQPLNQLSPVNTSFQEQSPAPTPDFQSAHVQQPVAQQPPQQPAAQTAQAAKPRSRPGSRPGSRSMIRTASMGALTLPDIPASDPILPPSTLQRSQTWSEAPHPATEAPVAPQLPQFPQNMPHSMMQTYSAEYFSECSEGTLQKRNQIRNKLEEALKKGELPPFCSNCGAIETPTWRKAWSQDRQGVPGYYEYSDDPGRVTCVNILTRDDQGQPLSYQIIKKFLAPADKSEDFKEYLLCNPCGIWMSKYKSQRPEAKWERYESVTRKGSEAGRKSRPTQRLSKVKKTQNGGLGIVTSDAVYPPSDAYYPQSEAAYPPAPDVYQQPRGTTGPPEGVSPTESTSTMTQQQNQQSHQSQQSVTTTEVQNDRRRSTSSQPPKRLKAMTSDAASAALRRAIQSSPARWQGTRATPIDLEDENLGSTRRVLFPSPRKDGSPKALGEVGTNVAHVAPEIRSPKEAMMEAFDKENCPPAVAVDEADVDLMALFEEEIARPSTPTQKTPPGNPFTTPTRKTPNHRPITRSVSRSINRSIRSIKSPGQLLLFAQTPSKTPRRSPRNHDHSVFESPFTATLNQLMSEANNQSPSRNNELDFGSMPELPNLTHHNNTGDFNLEDFFSTDVPMPSSPPRMFHLYEDPMTMQNIDWNEFSNFGGRHPNNGGGDDGAVIKTEPGEESPVKGAGEEKA